MNDYIPVPVNAAYHIASTYAKSVVVIASWDPVHALTHITTYGVSPSDKQEAAYCGDKMREILDLNAGKQRTFEDFRTRDQATWAAEREELSTLIVQLRSEVAKLKATLSPIRESDGGW